MAPSNVAFTLFGWSFYWYGILIALAALCAIYVAMKGARRYGISQDDIIDAALVAIPLAIIGGRLYYVAFTLPYYMEDWTRIFAVREGGMAIYGSVIGGALGVLIASRWKKIRFLSLVEAIIPALALGQAIGRWGNFFNQEAYGWAVHNPSLQFFPLSVYINAMAGTADGPWHMATFFYESVACLFIFVFLMVYRKKPRAPGNVALWYLLLYGIARAVIENFRTDSLMWGHLRVSQILSAALALAALVTLIVRYALSAKDAEDKPQAMDESLRIVKQRAQDEEHMDELLTGMNEDALVVEELVIDDEDAKDDETTIVSTPDDQVKKDDA